jgi:hypothetical protein
MAETPSSPVTTRRDNALVGVSPGNLSVPTVTL